MPSPAAQKYDLAVGRAMLLHGIGFDENQRKFSFGEKQAIRHACLAGLVAAWDGYVNNIIKDFQDSISNPLDTRFASLHSVAKELTSQRLSRFNTPNWDKSRELLVLCTGYDPIADWIWARRRMGRSEVQARLNETLKVWHSFAHGFELPPVDWLKTASGRVQISKKAVRDTRALFDILVSRTDAGLTRHIAQHYSQAPPW